MTTYKIIDKQFEYDDNDTISAIKVDVDVNVDGNVTRIMSRIKVDGASDYYSDAGIIKMAEDRWAGIITERNELRGQL